MQDKTISNVARELGRRGGTATIKKHGKDRMKEIGRLGGLKTKENKDKASKKGAK